MSAARKGFSLDDHQRLGGELFEIRERLLRLSVEVYTALPKNCPTTKAAHRAVRSVDQLRCLLDGQVCGLPGGTPRIYYPGSKPAGEVEG